MDPSADQPSQEPHDDDDDEMEEVNRALHADDVAGQRQRNFQIASHVGALVDRSGSLFVRLFTLA